MSRIPNIIIIIFLFLYFQDSIQEINLSANNVSDLGSGSFGGLLHLKHVDLRDNSLRSIPQGSIKINPMAGEAKYKQKENTRF